MACEFDESERPFHQGTLRCRGRGRRRVGTAASIIKYGARSRLDFTGRSIGDDACEDRTARRMANSVLIALQKMARARVRAAAAMDIRCFIILDWCPLPREKFPASAPPKDPVPIRAGHRMRG